MKKFSRMSKRKKALLYILLITIFIILFFIYGFMVYSMFSKNFFVDQAIQISDKNQNPVFKVQKVLLYSSANAVDNSQNKDLKDLNISQYTDIAVYIDNKAYISDLTQENTVKEISISDIQISKDAKSGIKSLTYKSPLNFGKFEITEAAELYSEGDTKYAPVKFNVLYQNQDDINYDNPTFFTDCSNPITLSYLNKDIITHYSLPDNSNISFNGSLLRQSSVDLNSLSTTLSFNINIKNNLNESFIYNIKINLAFGNDIYNGYVFQGREASGSAYNFFKEL